MTGELWLYAVLAVLGALNLLAVAFAVRRTTGMVAFPAAGPDGRGVDDADGGTTDAGGDDAVTCPHCDAVNERGYRYCRACVTELPGTDAVTDAGAPRGNGNVL